LKTKTGNLKNNEKDLKKNSHGKSIAKNKTTLIYLNAKINKTTIIVSDTTIKADETEKIIENLLMQIGGVEHFARSVENKYYNSLSLNNSIIDEMRENVSRLTTLSENHTTPAVTTSSIVIATPLPMPNTATN
jgi:3'-phosphoadenosine 5'-phosphosulfate sulfotransferase (PAPS reductase)/FAD synthetase